MNRSGLQDCHDLVCDTFSGKALRIALTSTRIQLLLIYILLAPLALRRRLRYRRSGPVGA